MKQSLYKLNFAILFTIVLITLLSSLSFAALIGGKVYDYSLNTITHVNVEINTTPKQRDVAENGVYAFNVPKGTYTITAKQFESGLLKAATTEQITVEQDGEYKLDLILFPDTSEEQNLIDEKIDIEKSLFEEQSNNISKADLVGIIIVIIIIAVSFIVYVAYFKKKKAIKHKKKKSKIIAKASETTEQINIQQEIKTGQEKLHNKLTPITEDADSKMVLDFIKANDGRTTQKDIRRNFPSSEAKISLVLTDLEAQGKIRKIKKGRGNVIVMK